MKFTNEFGAVASKLRWVAKECVVCPKCDRKQMGDMFVDETTTVKALDGRDAHPFIWFCSTNRKHQRKPGWTGPVDFTQLLDQNSLFDQVDGMPGPKASDSEWQEWAYLVASKATPEMLASSAEAYDFVQAVQRMKQA